MNALRFMVWLPEASRFAKYVSMGVNNAVYNDEFVPNNIEQKNLYQIAAQSGMKLWHYPGPALKRPLVIPPLDGVYGGVTILDEPVLHGKTPIDWQVQATDFRRIAPNRLVLGNLEGDKFSMTAEQQATRQKDWNQLVEYCKAPDIVTHDFYGWSRVRYNPDKSFLGWYGIQPMLNSFRTLKRAVENLKTIVIKETGVCVEMGNQQIDVNSRACTRQELRTILWSHLLLGATTFVLFVSRPNKKDPLWETYGDWADCMPPELQHEFMVNRPLMEQVAAYGKPDSVEDKPDLIAANWPGSRRVEVSLNNGVVRNIFGGNTEWAQITQSDFRPFSATQYPEQLKAQDQINQLLEGKELERLRKENGKLRDQLSRVKAILME